MGLFDRRRAPREPAPATPPAPGVAARATCVHSTCDLRFGDRPEHVEVGLDLLVHGPDGEGQTVHTEATLGWRIAAAICGWDGPDAPDWSDTELAVRVDPATGRYLCLDAATIREDMAGRIVVVDSCWADAAVLRQGMDELRSDAASMQHLPQVLPGLADGLKSVWDDIRQPAQPSQQQAPDGGPTSSERDGPTPQPPTT